MELWWQDEARIGQENKITRRWARRGTQPIAPSDQRTKSAYNFGAICPARDVGAGLVLPRCNTHAMQSHLEEISSQVAPGAHAVLLLDQAGWHTTKKLAVPKNYHRATSAAEVARAEPGREHLAVHARQLALKSGLPNPRPNPRPLLRGLEQADRPAPDHHVHRPPEIGQ